jgi:hypothetical protein
MYPLLCGSSNQIGPPCCLKFFACIGEESGEDERKCDGAKLKGFDPIRRLLLVYCQQSRKRVYEFNNQEIMCCYCIPNAHLCRQLSEDIM